MQPDHPAIGGQHRREYYTHRARRTKRPQFNQHLQYNLVLELFKWEIVSWDSRRQDYTIQNTSLPSQRLVLPPQAITHFPLMPLNPLAPAFFLHNQLLSDPPITLRRPTTMNLSLAQILC